MVYMYLVNFQPRSRSMPIGIQGPSTVTESDPPLQHQVVTRVEVHSWSACIVLYCRRSAEILLFCCYTRSGVIMLQVDMAKRGEN